MGVIEFVVELSEDHVDRLVAGGCVIFWREIAGVEVKVVVRPEGFVDPYGKGVEDA